MVTAQAIVVEKGHRPRIGELNRFLADVKGSGFVKTSLDRANVADVEVAPSTTWLGLTPVLAVRRLRV